MLSKIPQEYLKLLSVRDLETLLERKRQDEVLKELMSEQDRLTRELNEVKAKIADSEEKRINDSGKLRQKPIVVEKRKTLKEHISDVLEEANTSLTASEIQRRLIDRGLLGGGRNSRSFYNTVFQALQRYDFFVKEGKAYSLAGSVSKKETENGNATLKDFVVAVMKHSKGPLKTSEIASRVLIAGYQTELDQDGLTQRVSALLKKDLNRLFDWDSQRYRLISN